MDKQHTALQADGGVHAGALGLCLAEGGALMTQCVINSQLGWPWGLGPHLFPVQELFSFCLPAAHPQCLTHLIGPHPAMPILTPLPITHLIGPHPAMPILTLFQSLT